MIQCLFDIKLTLLYCDCSFVYDLLA